MSEYKGMTPKAEKVVDLFLETMKTQYRFPNWVKSPQIQEGLGIAGVDVRSIVHHHRCNGVLMLSGREGYSYTDNPKEAESTIRVLKQYSRSISDAVSGMEGAVNQAGKEDQGELELGVRRESYIDEYL